MRTQILIDIRDQLAALNGRVDKLKGTLAARIDATNERIESTNECIDSLILAAGAGRADLARIERRLDRLEKS